LDKKGKDDESSLLVRMMLLFQSSLTEQRQLIYCVENNNTNIAPLEKSYSKKYSTMSSITTTTTTTTTKSMKKRIPVLKDTQSEATTRIPKKKSLIPAPPADVSEVKKLRIENQETLRQLKQIGSIVKKAMGMIDTTTLRQMKPLLGKAILIYNAVLQQNQQQLSSVSPSTSDTIPPEKLRIQIHDLIGLDQHNRNINCSKIIQDLNQKVKKKKKKKKKEMNKREKSMFIFIF
jgi:hypothetical protein